MLSIDNNIKIPSPSGASINFANTIPKRVLQISEEIANKIPMNHICWKRFPNSNTNNQTLIHAKSSYGFIAKLALVLLTRKYSILLFDDLRLLPLLTIIKKITGAKLIYNRQEIPTVSAAQRLSKKFFIKKNTALHIAESFESFFAKKVDAIFTIPLSDTGIKRLKKWKKPLEILYNLPNLKDIPPIKNTSSITNNTLIYSGSISPENGLYQYLRLIRSINNHRKARLILIGHLWSLSRQDLFTIIESEDCTDHVEYHEWVSYDELTSFLSSSTVGLCLTDPKFEKYTHMSEGSSRKIFTYMSAGLPIIAGGVFGSIVPEVKAGYFINFNDEGALLSATLELLSNYKRANSMKKNGRKAILDKYNWESQQHKISSVIQNLL